MGSHVSRVTSPFPHTPLERADALSVLGRGLERHIALISRYFSTSTLEIPSLVNAGPVWLLLSVVWAVCWALNACCEDPLAAAPHRQANCEPATVTCDYLSLSGK